MFWRGGNGGFQIHVLFDLFLLESPTFNNFMNRRIRAFWDSVYSLRRREGGN